MSEMWLVPFLCSPYLQLAYQHTQTKASAMTSHSPIMSQILSGLLFAIPLHTPTQETTLAVQTPADKVSIAKLSSGTVGVAPA